MHRKVSLVSSVLILIALPFLAACQQATTAAPTAKPTEKPVVPTEVPEPAAAPTEVPAPVEGHWWDKFGEPQYGGTITVAAPLWTANFDNATMSGADWELWYDSLFEPDWALDRDIWAMSANFTPDEYWTGNLADTWEMTDPQTMVVHLKEGVYWQDKEPVNGREFVADDVVFHYDRMLGTGHGFTEPNPFSGMLLGTLQNVTATDDYTVEFHFSTPSPAVAFQTLSDRVFANLFEPPEVVEAQGGSITDWTGVVGTGPWILDDYVEGSSVTAVKNPNYHGTDPRYGNPVPYADELVVLIMPEASTQLAALRTGQIDLIDVGLALGWQQAQSLQGTNPELEWKQLPNGASGVSFRLDNAPFTDIRVRQAMQMAIDRESIANDYYGGYASTNPVGIVTAAYTGWAYPYEDWPQELKDQYVYDPDTAKALLAEAAADGVFTPNAQGGFDTDILASITTDLTLLEVFKSYFADIGISMEINAVDWPTYESMFRAAQHQQMVTFGGASTWPPTRIVSQWWSQGPDNGATKVNDPGYDAVFEAFQAADSLAAAAAIFQQGDKIVIENHWAVFGPESSIFLFWSPSLGGYSGEFIQWGRGATYAKLWITE